MHDEIEIRTKRIDGVMLKWKHCHHSMEVNGYRQHNSSKHIILCSAEERNSREMKWWQNLYRWVNCPFNCAALCDDDILFPLDTNVSSLEFICNNCNVLYKSKSIFFQSWFDKNILLISQLVNTQGLLFSYKEFLDHFQCPVSPK